MLVVCTANICRSPDAEWVIGRAIGAAPGFDSVRIASAGVQPVTDARICELVSERHRRDPGFADFAEVHRPSRVTAARASAASLILTASRSTRAALAALAPETRDRTFTLREAAILGEGYERDERIVGRAAVEAFARYLDERRGAIVFRPATSKHPDEVSIRDGHGLATSVHAAAVRSVEETAGRIARLITGYAGDRTA